MRFVAVWLVLIAALVLPTTSRAADKANTDFGFTGPEMFPIENGIALLHVADLDGDGLNDIIVANNNRSKITLLYNQTGKTNRVAPATAVNPSRELNELPPDARFRVESLASEKRISSMVVEDLNSDGRPDIAYYGEPKELILVLNQGTNTWSTPKRWPIEDGQLSPNSLATGDINGDKRTDLLLLGDTFIYAFLQRADHTFADPERIPFSGSIRSIQITDIDGDGRNDLLLVNWEDRNPFRFRLQNGEGRLGPEIYFAAPPIRSYWADNLETNSKTQLITISQNSGRAQISEFTKKPAESISSKVKAGQLEILPLDRTDKAKRGMIWADINGDQLQDLLVAEPESGGISIYLQQPDGTLGTVKRFPSLAGITDLAVADWEGDGGPELFLLSSDERQIGVTRLDRTGALPFPSLVPLDGRPLVMAVGKLRSGDKPVLATIIDRDGKRSLVLRDAKGQTTVQKLREEFRSNPSTMTFHDVDQDGLPDLVILTPYEKVKILRQTPDGKFQELDVPPPGGTIEQPWFSVGDVDGDGKPELLLTQKNFIRAVVLKQDGAGSAPKNRGDWAFVVKQQINGSAGNSRLTGAAAVYTDTSPVPTVFLLDVENKAITVCERDTNLVWQASRNLPLPFSEFQELEPVALGGKRTNALALMGINTVALLRLGGDRWDLTELDGYESPIKDARLTDVVSGDLNQDGRKDLVFLETARNYLDVVVFTADHKLVPANRWQVFEERTFRSRRSDMPEPREAVVADVTGDHRNDLIVIVHDRILVYPQD